MAENARTWKPTSRASRNRSKARASTSDQPRPVGVPFSRPTSSEAQIDPTAAGPSSGVWGEAGDEWRVTKEPMEDRFPVEVCDLTIPISSRRPQHRGHLVKARGFHIMPNARCDWLRDGCPGLTVVWVRQSRATALMGASRTHVPFWHRPPGTLFRSSPIALRIRITKEGKKAVRSRQYLRTLPIKYRPSKISPLT